MRKKVKILSYLLVFIVFSSKLQAQLPKALVFGNFTYANPQNDYFKNHYNNGVGFEIGAGVGFAKTIFIGSLGYMNYSASANNAANLKIMPVKLGVRQYLIGKLFVNGNIGLALQSYDNISGSNGNNFLYEIGAGVKVLRFIELGVAYTGWKLGSVDGGANANSLLFKAGFSLKI
ncbi:hypothetical protein ACI6Q2_11190 [Chitinophagaceae bacterium LWZ2-11]